MKLLNYNDFVKEQKLPRGNEEIYTKALIKKLSHETCPRILLEDFPQSDFQAKFFVLNCVQPSRVFLLECSKDIC